MKVGTIDLTKYQEMVNIVSQVLEHRRKKPTTKMDEAYYELLLTYYQRPLQAKEQGKPLVVHSSDFPPEVFYASDIIPLSLEQMATLLSSVLRLFEELGATAKSFGIASEVCSVHRATAGIAVRGWLPRPDAVVVSHMVCDPVAHSAQIVAKLYDVPFYFIERPYKEGEEEIKYYASQLEELSEFLDRVCGKRLDLDRLREALKLSYQIAQLQGEVNRLTCASPFPGSNRLGDALYMATSYFMGMEEGLGFCRTAVEELGGRVERGEGYYPGERFRLIQPYQGPAYSWKVLDWMGKEHGACIVAQPYCYHWGPWELDLEHPLETLARRVFATPGSRQLYSPAEKYHIPDIVEDAQSHHCQGAVQFAMLNCRQSSATIRLVKDALREQLGIPTLVLDIDAHDPSVVPEEVLKEKLEGFFEVLQEG